MFKKHFSTFVVLFLLVFATCDTSGQNDKKQVISQQSTIEVIQFHSEHRCVTCLKIEKLTRATLAKSYPAIPFRLVNVEDKSNEKIAEQFEATGTALFLYSPKTGKKLNLTEFAFMKAGNEAEFDAGLKKSIANFLKG